MNVEDFVNKVAAYRCAVENAKNYPNACNLVAASQRALEVDRDIRRYREENDLFVHARTASGEEVK